MGWSRRRRLPSPIRRAVAGSTGAPSHDRGERREEDDNVRAGSTRARVTCPTCGDVSLRTTDLTVLVHTYDSRCTYAFRCPECHLAASRNVNGTLLELLVGLGVRLCLWELPSELQETHAGAPLTPDDLLVFHEWLGLTTGNSSRFRTER